MKKTSEMYDVVIVDLPDPMTAQVNRFYTVEFFEEVHRVLHHDGVFSLSVTSGETMIGPALASLLASLRRTLETVYGEVVIYPGATARFHGSPSTGVPVRNPRILVERIDERKLDLIHVRDYYLLFTISEGRQQLLSTVLSAAEKKPVNRDLSPSLYYDSLVFWSAQHTPKIARFLRSLEKLDLFIVLVAGTIATFALALYGYRKKRFREFRLSLVYACFAAGFTEMTLTILLVLCFQVFYGSLYYKVALLLAAYMIGLMGGSRFMGSRLQVLKNPVKTLFAIQAALACYSLLLWLALLFTVHLSPLSWLWSAWEPGFPALLLIAGILGGLHFPLAGHLYARQDKRTGRTAGLIYGVDLAGSALGAVLAGMILLPTLGVFRSLVVLAYFNLLAATWLIFCGRRLSMT